MRYETQALLTDFADFQRSKALAEGTIRNRHSILMGLVEMTGIGLPDQTLHTLRRHIGRPGIKPSSRRTARAAILAFYEYAEDEGICPDPTRRLKPVKVPRREPRPFTWEQVERMLTTGAYRRTRVMILLGYFQGFRVGTIARVRGDDFDLLTGTVSVLGKGGKIALLPLHPVIRAIVPLMPPEGWWFPARDGSGGHVHSGSVSDLIHRAIRRAGITDPKLTPHSLRHGFATDLLDAGVDLRIVQELMMHQDIGSTQIYTGVSARQKRQGIESLPVRPLPARSGRVRRFDDELPMAA